MSIFLIISSVGFICFLFIILNNFYDLIDDVKEIKKLLRKDMK